MKRLFGSMGLTFIPALVWWTGVYLRPVTLDPYCPRSPETCTQQSVSQFDQMGMRPEVPGADLVSYYGQNFSAALAAVIPALVLKRTVIRDWNFLFRVAAWNGIFLELSHYFYQRPRPFVYQNLEQDGPNPMNYTSFWSGHTSYTTASNVALTLLLIFRNAPSSWILFMKIFGPILILTTAVCRVLAQRHFISDVMVGALAGAVIGWIVFRLHYKRKN